MSLRTLNIITRNAIKLYLFSELFSSAREFFNFRIFGITTAMSNVPSP